MADTIVDLVQGRSFTVLPNLSRTATPNTIVDHCDVCGRRLEFGLCPFCDGAARCA